MTGHDDVDCKKAIRALDDYVDRQLGTEDVQAIEHHLNKCPPCAKEFHFEHSVITEIRRKVAEVDIPCDLKTRVLARLAKFDADGC